jgi:DNA-binding NarL/FixJ family response regulator
MVHKRVIDSIYITVNFSRNINILIPSDNHNGLSKKETEVLIALSKGFLYKEIAAEQKITINTVKKHCKNIYRKLEVRNRTEASNVFLREKSA